MDKVFEKQMQVLLKTINKNELQRSATIIFGMKLFYMCVCVCLREHSLSFSICPKTIFDVMVLFSLILILSIQLRKFSSVKMPVDMTN